MKHLLIWSIFLAAFWLLLSGMLQPLLLVFGILSVLLCLYALVRMDRIDGKTEDIRVNPKMFVYVLWLLGQIVKSSLEVAKIIWTNRKVEPALISLEVDPALKGGRVLYANSLTLTPGTLSIDLDENTIIVHALDVAAIAELKDGEMQNRIIKARC